MNLHPCPLVRTTRFDPAPWLVAIPYLVGYNPVLSLVCVMTDGDRIVVVGRLDWRDAVRDPRGVAAQMVRRSQHSGATGAMLVAVRPESPAGAPAALRVIGEVFANSGVDVIWQGWITSEQWRSPDCDGAGCAPHFLPEPSSSDLVLELILAGAAPAATRQEVLAEVAPAPAQDRLPDVVGAADGLESWRDRAVADFMELVVADAVPNDDDVALLAAACHDIRVRDTVLHRITTTGSGGWGAVWRLTTASMRRAPLSHVASLGAVAALAAWQMGDGLRAGEALTRAREADPDHSLCQLLQRSLDGGYPPSVWGQVMAGLTEEECRYGRDRDAAA